MAGRRITRIEPQKKRSERFSVFLDNEFAFGISGELLNSFQLVEGKILTDSEVQAILGEEEKRKARLQAYRYLAIRDHSEKELETKLRRKGFDASLAAGVVSELKEKRFLDDAAFAYRFARDRLESKPMGRRQLSFELKKKGISEDLIDQILEALYSEIDEIDLALNLAKKKLPSWRMLPLRKRKEKLAQFLARRGFSWETITEAIASLALRDDEMEETTAE